MLPGTFKNTTVAIFGLGIEGIDLLHYLYDEGAKIKLYDQKSNDKILNILQKFDKKQIEVHFGNVPEDSIKDVKYAFVSQGIPLKSPQLEIINKNNIQIESMTSLFFNRCNAPIIGITGTSGKTTTTALVRSILEQSNHDYVIGGNIGVGMLGLLKNIKHNTKVIMELSHTQLQLLTSSPQISCLTNISPNHLDQFSWEEYIALKEKITMNQNNNEYFIVNFDDSKSKQIANKSKAKPVYFSMNKELEFGVYLNKEGYLISKITKKEKSILHKNEMKIRGNHNISNALAAIAITSVLGIESRDCKLGIMNFKGVEHRLESICKVNDIEFINDSMATTPDRTMTGLESIDDPIILLLGGQDKNLDFKKLEKIINQKCRVVIVFGISRKKILQEISNINSKIIQTTNLKDATTKAFNEVQAGESVLLSPGCASFDEFDNFAERGEKFKTYINQLLEMQGVSNE
ncbi:MAG: UDP-N-acetylmuramoyl-L-alanine--D-glutamate ligase [Chloroflexi bacterium]|nr:UDP-N-acetylmuramoyl-L-alanine--D-glutamate ligase [Chloroflexota bacterium]|tara:strand:- start:22327 stop:23709 length:1383 start_codon:yes stop_codon:yes gene_type:complete